MMSGSSMTIREILTGISSFISTRIMPILVGIAILYFVYNVIYFILNSGNEKERETFRNYIINSIIAMFILVSIWGIVGIGTRTLFNSNPIIPQLPTSDQ